MSIAEDDKLSKNIIKLFSDPEYKFWVSQVTFIEFTIKLKLGKLNKLNLTNKEFFESIEKSGFNILELKKEHYLAYQNLEFIGKHRDPFDRFIIATAIYEEMAILSKDQEFHNYADIVKIIW